MLNCEIQERSNCNNESLHGQTALLIGAHRSQSFGDSIDVILIPLLARPPDHFAVRAVRVILEYRHSVSERGGVFNGRQAKQGRRPALFRGIVARPVGPVRQIGLRGINSL